MVDAVVIPPSRTSSMKRKQRLMNETRTQKRKKCTKWLMLNAVCLTLNMGLLCGMFIFHAHWMPTPDTNLVLKAHLQNRREFWALLRGGNQNQNGRNSEQEDEKANTGNHNTSDQETDKNKDATAAEKDASKNSNNNQNQNQNNRQQNDASEKEKRALKIDYTLPTSPHNSPNDPDYDLSQQQYHIIFSTGCSDKQHWQSYILFHSILTSGQQGHVTRIASGCTEEEEEALKHIHNTQMEPMGNGKFHLHLTPEFGEGFHYNNKPYGVHHWMEAVLGYSKDKTSTDHDNTILFLLDPDQVIMRPFVNEFPSDKEIWAPRTTYPLQTRIMHGYPMAAEYGYKDQWHQKIDVTQIIQDSPVTNQLSAKDIRENYHAGPPYAATAKDFYHIVTQWRAFAQPVHDQYPYLLSEMFAYSLAAAHLKLPHQLARTFMVSDWKEPGMDLVTKQSGVESSQMCRHVPIEHKPHILHYCQRLALGKYMMTKHRLPDHFVGNQESCKMPLLMEPPDDVAVQLDYFVDVNEQKRYDIRDNVNHAYTKQEKINQVAFLLCEELKAFNLAATYYKEHHCPAEQRNLDKTLIFFDQLELTEEEKNQKGEVV